MPKPRTNVRQAMRAKGRARRDALNELAEAEANASQDTPRNDLLPKQEIVYLPIRGLKHAPRKVRKLDPAQVARLEASIQRLGFCGAIFVTADGYIIDGHARLQAAINLGLTHIPCIVQGSHAPNDIRLMRLNLNRLQETGHWDFPELTIELRELKALGLPIEITGFTIPEIDLMFQTEAPEREEQGPLEPEEEATSVCRPGQLWALGRHLIVCGDARRAGVYRALFTRGPRARLVLTDVPYNVPIRGHVTGGEHREFQMAAGEMSVSEFAIFNKDWMSAALEWLCKGGLLGTFIDWRSVGTIITVGQDLGLELLNIPVWTKTNAGMGSLWRSQHEMLPVFKNPGAPHCNNVELGRHGRWRSNVWNYPGASSMGSDSREGLKLHPTVKPTVMLEDALLDITDPDDVVIDPFLGSGSTLIAAENTGRVCHGIEIDPLYVDVAIRRWMAVTGDEPVLVCDDIFADDEPAPEHHLRLPSPAGAPAPTRTEG